MGEIDNLMQFIGMTAPYQSWHYMAAVIPVPTPLKLAVALCTCCRLRAPVDKMAGKLGGPRVTSTYSGASSAADRSVVRRLSRWDNAWIFYDNPAYQLKQSTADASHGTPSIWNFIPPSSTIRMCTSPDSFRHHSIRGVYPPPTMGGRSTPSHPKQWSTLHFSLNYLTIQAQ